MNFSMRIGSIRRKAERYRIPVTAEVQVPAALRLSTCVDEIYPIAVNYCE